MHCIKINYHSCFHNIWPNSKTPPGVLGALRSLRILHIGRISDTSAFEIRSRGGSFSFVCNIFLVFRLNDLIICQSEKQTRKSVDIIIPGLQMSCRL